METTDSRLRVSETLAAFNAVLKGKAGDGARASLWFKESSARNLRSRDFLAPRAALRAIFANGQVPKDIVESVLSLKCPGVPPIHNCQNVLAGLIVQLDRPTVFEQILTALPVYTKPPLTSQGHCIILNCVPLHGRKDLKSLSLGHLRAILITDHLAGLLQAQGINVQLVPAFVNEEIHQFLHQIQVDWPSRSEAFQVPEDILTLKETLCQCQYTTFIQADQDEIVCKLHLKEFLEKQEELEGYDPNLDVFLVTEEKLHHVAELQRVAQQCTKHLVCGPVKITCTDSCMNAFQYYQLRHSQMYKASVLKYGDLSKDASWMKVISVLTSAAIRFEMLSIVHQNQVFLDVEESNISMKGTKGGAFVMYNCARLATLFETYQRSVEQGLYPVFPPSSELNYSSLREEGEWLLLFNSILPFQEVLTHVTQLLLPTGGLRITVSTEAICKFLIQLSMDFSSYYNRVHILGEPRPHLFSQMFARLQLMRAVREVFHSALATFHLPPLSQI
ncbi:DALR anticodon-binding domain-containing protein 3 isoform X2 [Pseudonaja textilis]|uniref:DALR anticodon-binding domain-containing protein 3 isoform X2 n=1 Tax=Pseudonaja textilis TaxID=8673 RepID=UPI000EAA5860|nr:DALR anticodon-binding domain-containing protein 3 isoform X2 [Pseudonaja textilis]